MISRDKINEAKAELIKSREKLVSEITKYGNVAIIEAMADFLKKDINNDIVTIKWMNEITERLKNIENN